MRRLRRLPPAPAAGPLAQATLVRKAWQTRVLLCDRHLGSGPARGREARDPATARPHGHTHLPCDPELCQGLQREAEVKHPQAGFWGGVSGVQCLACRGPCRSQT